jgi:Na+/melibiose symporter-like transporter
VCALCGISVAGNHVEISAMARARFTFQSFLLRWVAALVLVFATYNPLGFSYTHWVWQSMDAQVPLKALAGLALLIFYIIYLRATWRSIGPVGVTLALAFFGAVVWVLVYAGVLAWQQTTVMSYVALILIATVMAVGLSWSHIRRRLSGQADIDDVDE